MSTPDIANYSNLNLDELLAHRAAIDARIEEMRGSLIEQAQRLGLAVSDGKEKKRRGRRPKTQEADPNE